jgi:hypothetical protein
MDLRFADGSTTAKPIVPGQPIMALMQFSPADVVLQPGTHLELSLGQGRVPQDPFTDGGYFAMQDRTPKEGPIPSQTLPLYPLAMPGSTSTVILHGGASSALILDAFSRNGTGFFAPPAPRET